MTQQPDGVSTPRHRSFTVRSVTFNDLVLLLNLLRSLLEQTCWLRYMTPRAMSLEIAVSEASRMMQGQSDDRLTLVAITYDRGYCEALGVAELIRNTQSPNIAEIAVVIRDNYQRQGVGRTLVTHLVQQARSRGIDKLRVEMLAENRAMRSLLLGLGLPYIITTSYGETQVIVDTA